MRIALANAAVDRTPIGPDLALRAARASSAMRVPRLEAEQQQLFERLFRERFGELWPEGRQVLPGGDGGYTWQLANTLGKRLYVPVRGWRTIDRYRDEEVQALLHELNRDLRPYFKTGSILDAPRDLIPRLIEDRIGALQALVPFDESPLRLSKARDDLARILSAGVDEITNCPGLRHVLRAARIDLVPDVTLLSEAAAQRVQHSYLYRVIVPLGGGRVSRKRLLAANVVHYVMGEMADRADEFAHQLLLRPTSSEREDRELGARRPCLAVPSRHEAKKAFTSLPERWQAQLCEILAALAALDPGDDLRRINGLVQVSGWAGVPEAEVHARLHAFRSARASLELPRLGGRSAANAERSQARLRDVEAEARATEIFLGTVLPDEPEQVRPQGSAPFDFTAALQALSTEPHWTKATFEDLAQQFGLRAADLRERINSQSIELTGEPLLGGTDPITINSQLPEYLLG